MRDETDIPSGASGRTEPDQHDQPSLGRQVPHAVIWYTELNRRHSTIALLNNARNWPRANTVLSTADVKFTMGAVGTIRAKKVRIVRVPGTRLMSCLGFLLTPSWYRLRIAPTIADMHEEYYHELKAGNLGHARYIAIRGHMLVVKVLVTGIVQALKDLFFRA